jgi:hypothetical protein
MTGGTQQSDQLLLTALDYIGQRRAQLLDDEADGLRGGERVCAALSASGGSQGLLTVLTINVIRGEVARG